MHDNESRANKMTLQSDFFTLKMEYNDSMESYIRKATIMSEQLKNVGIGIAGSMVAAQIVTGLPSPYSRFIPRWNLTKEEDQTLVNLKPQLVD